MAPFMPTASCGVQTYVWVPDSSNVCSKVWPSSPTVSLSEIPVGPGHVVAAAFTRPLPSNGRSGRHCDRRGTERQPLAGADLNGHRVGAGHVDRLLVVVGVVEEATVVRLLGEELLAAAVAAGAAGAAGAVAPSEPSLPSPPLPPQPASAVVTPSAAVVRTNDRRSSVRRVIRFKEGEWGMPSTGIPALWGEIRIIRWVI